jgi:prevent-host-death family protein
MTASFTISKTELARHTRQVVNQARRGQPVIVESYGEEQVAILDASDYRCLRALAAYYARPPQLVPGPDVVAVPHGLGANELEQELTAAAGDVQSVWNRVIAAYLDGDISIGRAASLLELSRFELQERFNRLGMPLRIGPVDLAEARREVS